MKPMLNYKSNMIALATTAALSLGALPAVHAQDATQNAADTAAAAPPDSTAMAPPVTPAAPAANKPFDAAVPASQSVYDWHDVPTGQQVPIVRATFDQGGYQLYDDKGETIVVPFINQNLYVMKFGKTDGQMYFVNDGKAPTLYIPRGGYLTNSAAAGSKWFPFDKDFAYTNPVYIGPAPSWDEYEDMAWYPGMVYYGGYWGYNPWAFGVGFSPMPGLYFNIGGFPYFGWGAYHNYYFGHPYNRFYVHGSPAYRYAGVPHAAGSFGHYSGGYAFRGGSVTSYSRSATAFGHGGQPAFGTGRSSEFAPRGFGGTTMRSFGSVSTSRSYSPSRAFSEGSSVGGGHVFSGGSFSGGRSFFGGGASGGHSFSGGGGAVHAGGGGGRR